MDEEHNVCDSSVLIFSATVNENADRLSKLRDVLGTEHLSSEEQVSLIKICEEYNDVFCLS
jgi:hypothetical protein